MAGSDFDNDRFVCDEGEARGAWQDRSAIRELDFDGSMTGVDFTTGFLGSFQPAGAAPMAVAR